MIKELNEQIQRLRNVLVTCYKAIKEKGGSIPEEGERNMTNLPAAVLSIPQSHGVLTKLEVIADGDYLPADYDADGFSKVTARFDTSSLPKVKVASFSITDDCISKNGRFEGAKLIDTSLMTNCARLFFGLKNLTYVDISNWNIENATEFTNMFGDSINITKIIMPKITSRATNLERMFGYTRNLLSLDTYGWDTSNVTNMNNLFYNSAITNIDATSWDVSKVNSLGSVFQYVWGLVSVVGDRTYKQVADDNIAAFNGARSSVLTVNHNSINEASLRAIINGLADVNDVPVNERPTLTIGRGNISKLTEEDKAIATEKGWNLA